MLNLFSRAPDLWRFDTDPAVFYGGFQDANIKSVALQVSFAYYRYLLWVDKVTKTSQNCRNQGFPFFLLILYKDLDLYK